MSVQFRRATEYDLKELKAIAKRVVRANYTSFLGADMVASFIESGMSDKEIDDGIDSCTLMLSNSKIIGFVITKEDILHLIMVDVPYQNKGYGKLLMLHTEENLFNKYDTIRLQTFEENRNTIQFYLKRGWAITKQQHIPEFGKTMLFFEKYTTS